MVAAAREDPQYSEDEVSLCSSDAQSPRARDECAERTAGAESLTEAHEAGSGSLPSAPPPNVQQVELGPVELLEPQPLCDCQRAAKLDRVSASSPNYGRWFWTCNVPVDVNDRCDFFAWARVAPSSSALPTREPEPAPAISSVPLRLHSVAALVPVPSATTIEKSAAGATSVSARTRNRVHSPARDVLTPLSTDARTGDACASDDSRAQSGAALLSALDSLSSLLPDESPLVVTVHPEPALARAAAAVREVELDRCAAIADAELFAARCLERWLAIVPELRRKRTLREAASDLCRKRLGSRARAVFAAWHSTLPTEAARRSLHCAIEAIGARRRASLVRDAFECWSARSALLARVRSFGRDRQLQSAPTSQLYLSYIISAWRGFCAQSIRLGRAEARARTMVAHMATHRVSVCFYAWLTRAQHTLFIAAITSRARYAVATRRRRSACRSGFAPVPVAGHGRALRLWLQAALPLIGSGGRASA